MKFRVLVVDAHDLVVWADAHGYLKRTSKYWKSHPRRHTKKLRTNGKVYRRCEREWRWLERRYLGRHDRYSDLKDKK